MKLLLVQVHSGTPSPWSMGGQIEAQQVASLDGNPSTFGQVCCHSFWRLIGENPVQSSSIQPASSSNGQAPWLSSLCALGHGHPLLPSCYAGWSGGAETGLQLQSDDPGGVWLREKWGKVGPVEDEMGTLDFSAFPLEQLEAGGRIFWHFWVIKTLILQSLIFWDLSSRREEARPRRKVSIPNCQWAAGWVGGLDRTLNGDFSGGDVDEEWSQ